MNIIEEFKRIRDIPYRIPLSLEEPDECCTGKAEALLKIFEKAGYEARYRVCTFKWSSLKLPDELRNVPHGDDSTHTYLEVRIEGKRRVVDATWDRGLEGLFGVNEWNGKTDTEKAVPCIECFSPEKSATYMKEISAPEAIRADLAVNGAFYKAFNEWLEDYRTHHSPIQDRQKKT